MKITIDGQEFGADETGAMQRAIVELETSRADGAKALRDAETENTSLRDKIAELEPKATELDVLKADADKDDKGTPPSAEEQAKARLDWANDRFELVEMARGLKLDGFDKFADVEGDNDAIKRSIVFSRFDEEELPTEAHVDAALAIMRKADTKQDDGDDRPTSTKPLANLIAGNEVAKHDAANSEDTIAAAQKRYDAWVKGGCKGDLEATN